MAFRFGREGACRNDLGSSASHKKVQEKMSRKEREHGHDGEVQAATIKCICNGAEYFIPVGEGNQTVRWLGLVLAHRVKNEKKTHGRLQQRQRMKSNDGRDVVVPLPLLVQAGKHKDFCDPRKKIKDLLSSHGHNLT